MVFTGVRLSWVAFRLGAMINYEFSNLLHNEVTPSNPIKKNHQDPYFFFFLVSIYFPGILSPFFGCLQTRYIYFLSPLKEKKKNHQWLHLQPFWVMVTFYASEVTQSRASPKGIQACGWAFLSLPGQHRRLVRWMSFCCIWVTVMCTLLAEMWWAGVYGQVRETHRFRGWTAMTGEGAVTCAHQAR